MVVLFLDSDGHDCSVGMGSRIAMEISSFGNLDNEALRPLVSRT